MIKIGDIVYCHTSLTFNDGTISFTKGKSYKIIDICEYSGEVTLENNDGDPHSMGSTLSDYIPDNKFERENCEEEVSWKCWFSHREEKLKQLLDD